jgi:hypothetical protein
MYSNVIIIIIFHEITLNTAIKVIMLIWQMILQKLFLKTRIVVFVLFSTNYVKLIYCHVTNKVASFKNCCEPISTCRTLQFCCHYYCYVIILSETSSHALMFSILMFINIRFF